MKAFIPNDITDAMLVSSTIAEPALDEPLYSAAVTYAEFAQVSVISANSHLVYESLISGNLNNNPILTDKVAMPDNPKWILKGYTNRFRMFDWNQGTPSTGISPMTVTIRPGKRISAIMLEGLKASTVDITVTNGGVGDPVFTLDGYLLNREAVNPYDYFFAEFDYTNIVVTFEIPPVPDPVITMILTDPSEIIEIGRFATGTDTYLGTVKWNPVSDMDNYSVIEWNQFGKAKLEPKTSIPKQDLQVVVDASRIDVVRRFRDKANAKAVCWSALDDKEYYYTETLVLMGAYRKFDINIENPSYVVANLSIKGI